jgi:ethanolamine ammonia-lyase large subunit
MLRGEFESAGELEPDALRKAYDERLIAAIESVGKDTVAEQTGIPQSTIEALMRGETPDISLEEAAAILGTEDGRPDAESIEAEARDILLMGMTTAVLDVEALASEIDDALEPKEIQQKIEGRFSISIDEYALIHTAIEARTR